MSHYGNFHKNYKYGWYLVLAVIILSFILWAIEAVFGVPIQSWLESHM